MEEVNIDYLDKHKKFRFDNKKLATAFIVSAFVITIIVFWWLKLIGITVTGEAFCGLDEHIHSDECYTSELICGFDETDLTAPLPEEENSTKDETSEEETTTQQEIVVEEASEEETDEDTSENEKTTGEEIATEETKNTTERTEETEVTATKETTAPTTETPTEPSHTHTDDCYNTNLSCTKAEHIHTEECFPDLSADTETVSDWLSTIESVEITNNIPENLIAIAMTQVGYEESSANFEFDDNGNKNGYTRYGEWYGNPYGNWNTMFVSFCLHYSNINNDSDLKASSAEALRLTWIDRALYSTGEEYSPERGDIIFIDNDEDGVADTTGIVLSPGETNLVVIMGDSNNSVETVNIELSESIIGYGLTGNLSFAEDKEYEESETETENIIEEEKENTNEEEENLFSAPLMLFSTPRANITYINDLTSVIQSVTIKTQEGEIIGEDSTVYIGQNYIISMRFAEKNTGDQWIQFQHDEDHHLHYQIPENLQCDPFTEWQPITAKTENGTIENVGEYIVNENGLLIVKFHDDPDTGECFGSMYSNVDFTIDFNAIVASTQSGTSTDVVFNEEIKVNLNIDSSAEMKVTKTHGAYNGKDNTLEYQIKIEATKAVIKDLVVPDDIWEKHHVLKDTIVVTDLEGNVLDPQPTIGPGQYSGTAESGFTLSGFPDFAAGEGYIITYKAALNDDQLTQEEVGLWNGVYPSGKDATGKDVTAKGEDWAVVELNKIEKDGKQTVITKPDGTVVPVIEWQIEIKKSDSNLQGTVLVDTLGHGLEYYTGTPIVIKRYDQWGNKMNNSTLNWNDVEIKDNSMSFELPEGYRFVITYYTTYEELQEGEQKHYTNTAKVTINQREEVAGGEADVVGFVPNIRKSASGNDGEFVYFTIETDVPGVIKDWGGFMLTDLAAFWGYNENAEGYLYVENVPQDLFITAVTKSGKTVTFTPYVPGGPTENTYILVTPAGGNQHHSFNIYFNTSETTAASSKWILAEDSKLTISYKLPFDAKTGVEWTGELQGDLTIEDVLLQDYKLANEAYLNFTDIIQVTGSTTYEYAPKIIKKAVVNEDGTIDYTVAFRNTIPGSGGNNGYLSSAHSIIFTDTFDERLEYVEDSLTVTCYDAWRKWLWINKYKYSGEIKGNTINVSANELLFEEYNYAEAQYNADGSELWGTWPASMQNYQVYCNAMKGGEHVFTYKLKLKDEYLYTTEENQYELDNTAELKWDADNTSGPVTETAVIKTGLLDKQAVQENNKLFFDIHVNRNALDILKGTDTLTIEDTMTQNLSVYWDTIKLFYEDKATGNWIDFDSADSQYSYTVTYDQASNKLTFILPDSLHIRIDYTTLITESGHVSVSNTVKVDGKASITDLIDATFKVEQHSGGASGSIHDIMLLKQDGETDVRLPDVTFHLYGPMGNPDAVLPDGADETITTESGKTLQYIGSYTTGEDGTTKIATQYLTFGGPYALVEVAPPPGYMMPEKPTYFYYYEPDPNGVIQTVTTLIAVENYTYGFVFPETGGTGTLPLAIVGVALMAYPILYSTIRRKRERRLT